MDKKIALVTGASRGIGRAIAIALAQDGYRIAIHYRKERELAESLAQELADSKIFQADLASKDACANLLKEIKTTMGDIDLLVNNAGVSKDQLITFAKEDDFNLLLESNLKPVFLLAKHATKGMIRKKAGCIINVTSVVGHTGNAGQAMYAATKGAITALSKSLAQELAGFGIRCNCVAPGFIETDMTGVLDASIKQKILEKVPLKRLGSASEVAQAVAFLASDRAAYITGTTLHVNGGMY